MKSSLLALATLGALAGSLPPGVSVAIADGPAAQTWTNGAKSQPATGGQHAPGDTKAARLGDGYMRRWRAPVGKRYSASVRQHQRHAAKARRRSAAR